MGSANTATHSAMWLARQLCTRIPIRGRVNQQRRGMGFFGDLKANFKKELDKNKVVKRQRKRGQLTHPLKQNRRRHQKQKQKQKQKALLRPIVPQCSKMP